VTESTNAGLFSRLYQTKPLSFRLVGLKLFYDGFNLRRYKASSAIGFYCSLINIPADFQSRDESMQVLCVANDVQEEEEESLFHIVMARFVRDFLRNRDFQHKGHLYHLEICVVVADSPMRAKWLAVKSHSGFRGCHLCLVSGDWDEISLTFEERTSSLSDAVRDSGNP